MGCFPRKSIFGIPLRKWCIYGSILEMLLFAIPSVVYAFIWNESQQDNRVLFGLILVVVLTLSVFLLIGAYARDSLFILIWILGTICSQFLVNSFYSFVFILSLSNKQALGYTIMQAVFAIMQTVAAIVVMWLAIGYYNVLERRRQERSLVLLHTLRRPPEENKSDIEVVPSSSAKRSNIN